MRIVCISDTHGKHSRLTIPPCDTLISAGDFCVYGQSNEVKRFRHWLREQPAKHKVCISGNHDLCMDCFTQCRLNGRQSLPTRLSVDRLEGLFKKDGIHYLRDSSVVLDGVKFYGSPWQPEFYNWSFQLKPGPELVAIWSKIPDDVEVLVTHGPPYGQFDRNKFDDGRCGDMDLAMRIRELKKLRLHCYGHVHEGYASTPVGVSPIFVNAAICDLELNAVNQPVVVDL